MPVWGETMLDRMVDLLRSWGVDDIAVNSHHLHEQIRVWSDNLRKGFQERGEKVRVKVSYEPEILGNGGALNPLREWIAGEPFLIVNGDIVVDGLEAALGASASAQNGAGAALGASASAQKTMLDVLRGFACEADPEVIAAAIVTEEGPRTIEVEPTSGFVTNWRSDDCGADGTFTYAGITLLKPAILDYIKPDGFSSIITAYEKAMADGKFVKAIAPAGMRWADAGTVMNYIDLNRDGEDNAFAAIPQLRAARASTAAAPAACGSSHAAEGSRATEESTAAAPAASFGPEAPKLEFLCARGSERVFFRHGRNIIVIYDDGNRDENGKYAGHSRWLKAHGIPVPEIVADLPALKTLVMGFAGIEKKMTLVDYAKVVETLVKFNALGAVSNDPLPDLLPPFDDETWEWERNLFEKYCLRAYFNMEMPPAVRKELESVAARLEAEPKALVHRDFQSTNVLWKTPVGACAEEGARLTFIAFQGMRLGPAAYDLASLVYDPYVEFSERDRAALIALYAKLSGRPEIVEVTPFAAIERLAQCLGAFGRLASVGQPQFRKHVVPALRNLLTAADEAGLDAIGALAEDLLAKATVKKNEDL